MFPGSRITAVEEYPDERLDEHSAGMIVLREMGRLLTSATAVQAMMRQKKIVTSELENA